VACDASSDAVTSALADSPREKPFRPRGSEELACFVSSPQKTVDTLQSFRPNRRHHGARRPSVHSQPTQAPQQAAPPPPMTAEIAAAIDASAFAPLGIAQPLVRALLDEGYTTPTPVQVEVVPHALAGRDIIAGAQTGTGKTAAFVIPMLQRLTAEPVAGPRRIRALILTPTRELASQIDDSIASYGRHMKLRHTVVYGGVSQYRQEVALRASPDILVATPGRLLDLMQQRLVDLGGVSFYVLDEADRMLDMGFIHDVRRITQAVPSKRQTLLFSATIAPAIETLARHFLIDPVRISIEPAVTTAEGVDQSVVFVSKEGKRAALEKLLGLTEVARAIVFTRTKHGANRLSEQLDRAGIGSAAIHGNKSQGARERALESFRKGETRVLVATDVAARGIDVDNISHIINYDLPNVAETYVHRIGRTGRAGRFGRAISFCDAAERGLLRDIERLIKKRIPIVTLAS
jgi:ATP-dependent RNA helicase RhlE